MRATLIVLTVLTVHFVTNLVFAPIARRDPDRYFHLALSRQISLSGNPKTLPQVEDAGWGKRFPEKEYLFHQFTSIAYRISGEEGVIWGVRFLSALTLLVLVGLASSYLGAWPSAILILCSTIAIPSFAQREALLRPHVLAIFCFSLLLTAILKRLSWLAAFAGFLFMLSYHAFYIPCALLAISLAVSLRSPREHSLFRASLAGFAGMGLGTLLNPYFPANIETGTQHLRIALQLGNGTGLREGMELIPYSFSEFLMIFLFPLLLLALSLRQFRSVNKSFRVLLGVSILFWIATLISPRASEYAIPCTAILTAVAVSQAPRAKRAVLGILGISLASQLPIWIATLQQRASIENPRTVTSKKALSLIPESSNAKVFNCTWDLSPLVFYYRPTMRFVDILDPSFLYLSAPEKHSLRDKIVTGQIQDIYDPIRSDFNAEFVFCSKPEFFKKLKTNDGFKQLYPPESEMSPGSVPALYLFEVQPLRARAEPQRPPKPQY